MNPVLFASLAPTLVLAVGVVDDLRSRKVHNSLVVALFVLVALYLVLAQGLSALPNALLAFGLALALTLPLVLARVLGAGDMKLFAVFALATTPNAVFFTIVYSLVWGALLGVFRAILQGQGVQLLRQTLSLATARPTDQASLHRIPYTVALFFGWLTHLTMMGVIR